MAVAMAYVQRLNDTVLAPFLREAEVESLQGRAKPDHP